MKSMTLAVTAMLVFGIAVPTTIALSTDGGESHSDSVVAPSDEFTSIEVPKKRRPKNVFTSAPARPRPRSTFTYRPPAPAPKKR